LIEQLRYAKIFQGSLGIQDIGVVAKIFCHTVLRQAMNEIDIRFFVRR
jgi:HD superfamily phosphohydrolase YqeK